MIIDTKDSISRYREIGELRKAIDYIMNCELSTLPTGRTEIDGDALFCNVQSYETRPAEAVNGEVHDQYIDLQYMIEGSEIMGYHSRKDAGEVLEAKPEQDIWFYKNENMSEVLMEAGMFAVFFPQDVHAPCISPEIPGKVRKAVFKIKVR